MREGQQTYILSLEASDIYSHMVRDEKIKMKFTGMIPFSLELMKLKSTGMKIKTDRVTGKQTSNDVINVNFSQKVKSGLTIINILKAKIKNLDEEKNKEYIQKLSDYIDQIEKERNTEKWNEISNTSLREYLYKNGFTIKTTNTKGKPKLTKYVVYKRSSSKSRTGQCLFIKESLYKEMIDWSRMYLPFKKNMIIDYAGLLAYESLVGSSLESTIQIHPENILIVDDVESSFELECNIIKTGENELLDSITDIDTVNNSLFDGESLLDEMFFEDGHSMKLLRNHMFKSAAFNTKLQRFFEKNCPKGIDYEDWYIYDMFGNKQKAKDILMVITPSSLKALKFSSVIGSDKDMYQYWKEIVHKDGNIFGVCKHEKRSKRGTDEQGNPLQQTSYQMLNCMPMEQSDINSLLEIEKDYIDRLKNDDVVFVNYLKNGMNAINSNGMFIDLYKRNPSIASTRIFKDFRKAEINKYVSHVKKGKLRLKGDYCVLFGNPVEFLYHSIGKFNKKDSLSLKDNEVYTNLFEFNKELVCFRNPNTSPSNVLIVKNKQIDLFEKFFNLTPNIVCVNAIKFPIQDILSGCDYDSDTMVIYDNPSMMKLAKQCFGKYKVCLNRVNSQKIDYRLNKEDMFKIDNQLSSSQRNIGKVVNLGQICMSTYWDLLNKGVPKENLKDLLKSIDIMTVLSGICIDLAKKFYDIDIDKEIENVSKTKDLRKNKPLFWQYVSQSKTIKSRIEMYRCPMDYLYRELSDLKYAEKRDSINLIDLLDKQSLKDVDRKQQDKIIEYANDLSDTVRKINATTKDKKERRILMTDAMNRYNYNLKKLNVKSETVFSLLNHISKENVKEPVKLMNLLYINHKDIFIKIFKKEKKTPHFF